MDGTASPPVLIHRDRKLGIDSPSLEVRYQRGAGILQRLHQNTPVQAKSPLSFHEFTSLGNISLSRAAAFLKETGKRVCRSINWIKGVGL